jgi:hypothetical protein
MSDPTREPRKPDSLLISLKELRQIENHRIDTEQLEQQRLEHEQRLAVKEAELRASQEAERRVRQREERAKNQREATEREDRLRLAESERRARVEAEMRLAQERLKLEMASAAGRKKHSSAWGTISVVLVVFLSGGLAISGYELHKQSGLQRVSEQQSASLEQVKSERYRSDRALVLAQDRLRDQGTQIKLLQTQIQSLSTQSTTSQPAKARKHPKKRAIKKDTKPLINVVKCNPNDPICGIIEPKKNR